MIVRQRRASGGNHDRWLVSYADFITLLFAFFVVLFASSHADRAKARRVSDSVQKAFRQSAEVPRAPVPQKLAQFPNLTPVYESLREKLRPEVASGKMRMRMETRGIVISLNQASFFPSGEDKVDPGTIGSLGKVADVITGMSNMVRLEGHTDSIPIRNPRFRSNWDLSSARAIAVMILLQERWRVSPGRLAVTGYADTIPVESNETEEGRAKNRRVDLAILNADGANLEPARTLTAAK